MGRNTRRVLIAALVVLGAGVAGAQTTPMMTATTSNTSSLSALPATEPTVEQIVALAQTVEPGAAGVTAFTVPAGRRLVVTDVVITNPSTTPVCGAAISPRGATAGATTTGTTTGTTTIPSTMATTPSTATTDNGTITSGGSTTITTPGGSTVTTPATSTATASTAAIESGTGTLCVPALTSLTLSLTTGLEFAGGQSVVLANQLPTTTTTSTATTATTRATAAATPTGPLFYHLRGFLVTSGV